MSSQESYRPDEPILEAARRLIRSPRGSEFTMDRLAEECRISRATLYRQVGSREKLMRHLARQAGQPGNAYEAPDVQSRVLAATHRVISTTGSLNFTIQQVAEEAGVGVATVYRHFGDKASLLKAFSEGLTPLPAVQDLRRQTGDDLEAELTRFATEALQFIYKHRDLARMLISADAQTIQTLASLRASQDRTMNILTGYLEKQVEAGELVDQPPFDLANAFMGMLFGFAFMRPSYRENNLDNPEALAHFIVELFLRGTRPYQRSTSQSGGLPRQAGR